MGGGGEESGLVGGEKTGAWVKQTVVGGECSLGALPLGGLSRIGSGSGRPCLDTLTGWSVGKPALQHLLCTQPIRGQWFSSTSHGSGPVQWVLPAAISLLLLRKRKLPATTELVHLAS